MSTDESGSTAEILDLTEAEYDNLTYGKRALLNRPAGIVEEARSDRG